jgi:diguanylate cyclase (GGDEF)-like protein
VSNDAERGKPLAVLTTAADALARGSDLDATLGAILGAAVEATGANRAIILLQDPDRPDLELAGSIGLDDAAMEAARVAAQDAADPLVVAARTRTPAFGRPGVGDSTVQHADLPLVVSRGGIDRTVGVASFVWPADATVADDDRALLLAAADLLATAIDRAHLASTVVERSEWFERMAHTAPLTGLANHRTFARILELEIARAARQGGEVSIAIFDVDDFAETNAEAGAEVGDDVLRTVASLLAESVRLVDTVARYGGDEFVLVAPGAAGATVARRVLDGIGALPMFDGRTISISAGVARFPNDGADATELLAAAEGALVRAREEGRGSLGEASGVARGA